MEDLSHDPFNLSSLKQLYISYCELLGQTYIQKHGLALFIIATAFFPKPPWLEDQLTPQCHLQ